MKKVISTLLILILLILTAVFIFKVFSDQPTFNNEGKVIVYLDGINDNEYDHIFKDENIYISAKYLMKNEILDFYWDKDYNKISIFNDFNYNQINYNDKKVVYKGIAYEKEVILLVEDDELYFNANFIKDEYKERIFIDLENLSIIIENNTKEYLVSNDSKIKGQPTSKSDNLKKVKKEEHIYVYNNENEQWVLCRTEDNIIGYIKLSDITPIKSEIYKEYSVLNKTKEINLAWDLKYEKTNKFVPFDIPTSIDIIAPTWYALEDTKDFFRDISNDEYISYVKGSNKEIWGVFSNSFDPKLTNTLLNNGIKRSEIADRIIEITLQKKYDGINIDFENIYMADKDVLSAFIKELYCKARDENIILSVDITILSNAENWSLCYDREAIGKYSDYVILMAYDEHTTGTPGSVSSLPWVEYGVKNLLESVESEKIVLAIPFYSRMWKQYEVNGEIKTESSALRLQTAKDWVEELEIELNYDDSTGQNYGTKIIDDITYIIWNEDETSLKNRLKIKEDYNLTGKAIWAFAYGTDEVWQMLE